MRVAFIGLGQMGAGMAANLLRAGHTLTVWNRSPDKALELVEAGATLATSPRDAARGQEAVVTMLADDAALRAVLGGEEGLLAGLPEGAFHLSMSTIAVDTAADIAGKHAARQQRFLSAPVFGRPEAAAAAKLFIVAAGDSNAYRQATPLFEALGQKHFHLGERPEAANLLKLCGNFMILSVIEMMAEAMTLAAKGGIPRGTFIDIMTGTLFNAPVMRTYGTLLAEDRVRPAGFSAPLGLKDMRLVGQAAEGLRVPMPLLAVVRDHLLQTLAAEGEDVDWSAIGRSIARNAGL